MKSFASQISYAKNSSSLKKKKKVEHPISTRYVEKSHKFRKDEKMLTDSLSLPSLGRIGSWYVQISCACSDVWTTWLNFGTWNMCGSDILRHQPGPTNLQCHGPQPLSSLSAWLEAEALSLGHCTMDGDRTWGKGAALAVSRRLVIFFPLCYLWSLEQCLAQEAFNKYLYRKSTGWSPGCNHNWKSSGFAQRRPLGSTQLFVLSHVREIHYSFAWALWRREGGGDLLSLDHPSRVQTSHSCFLKQHSEVFIRTFLPFNGS